MMAHPQFSIDRGWLIIEAEGAEPRHLKPFGCAALDIVHSSDHRAAFVLIDPGTGNHSVGNIVRILSDGSVDWRSEPPRGTPNDAFVSLREGAAFSLVANTWSGYRVVLDSRTGRIVSEEFVK